MTNFRIHRVVAVLAIAGMLAIAGCGSGGSGGGSRDNAAPEAANPAAEALNASLRPVFVRDAKVDDYLRELGSRITTAAGDMGSGRAPTVVFHLVDAGQVINVASLGAGHLYVTNELFQHCRNEEELAACMSHAYAHLYLRQKAPPSSGSDGEMTVEQLVLARVADRYTLQQEQQADATAYQLFARAGWIPDRYGSFFQAALDGGLASSAQARSLLSSRAALRIQLPAASRDWESTPSRTEAQFMDLKSRAVRAVQSMRDVDPKARNLIAALPNCLLGEDQPEQLKAQAALRPTTADPSDAVRGRRGGGQVLHR